MIGKKKMMVLCSILSFALLIMPGAHAWAQTVLTEKGINQDLKFSAAGALREGSHKVKESNGGPSSSLIKEVGYQPNSLIEIEVGLTVEKGSYKVEFKNMNETSLVLEAKDGSSAEGHALVSVDAMGNLPYSVTSDQAENVVMTIKVK